MRRAEYFSCRNHHSHEVRNLNDQAVLETILNPDAAYRLVLIGVVLVVVADRSARLGEALLR
jgi:hypothetical protein